MKKLVLVLAVAFGASMVACSSSDKATDNAEGQDTVATEEVVAAEVVTPDSAAAPVDSAAAAAPADSTAAPAEAK